MLRYDAAILAHAAHDKPLHADASWWTAWNWDPLIVASLMLVAGLYALGTAAIWRRAGAGHGVSRGQTAAFAAALLTLVAALLSPIDRLSAELAWVHMIQHMLLMMVAAPLFMVAGPARVSLWAILRFMPARWRQGAGIAWRRRMNWRPAAYLLWQPIAMWFLYALALWIWHTPGMYQAALQNEWVHDAQHLTFFITSCLFWRVLLDPLSRLRMNLGLGVIYLFTTSLHASVLGVLLALSPTVWYAHYEATAEHWPLTALEDQQLSGMIMWIPACGVYAAAAAGLFAMWMLQLQRQPPGGGVAEYAVPSRAP